MIAGITNLMKKAIQLPKAGYDYLLGTHESNNYQKNSTLRWDTLSFNEDVIREISKKLQFPGSGPQVFTQSDHTLITDIRKKTSERNRNNITRTKAYLDFYKKHPEIHWAFLAHLVSRNGGWNMTDLKGSILDGVLSVDAETNFFSFLERANACIFYDAFPQLLLYEASKKRNKNLFYLLPKLGVSRFMRPFWDFFFEQKDPQLLTIALIINEQNYIEHRVVQHPSYKEKVLNNIVFQLQEVLQFTYVLFPFKVSETKNRLAGVTVSDFENIRHRIEIGKKLYNMLFGIKNLFEDISKYALEVPHTGSRSDYSSRLFTKNSDDKLDMTSLSCRPKKPITFSPRLNDAWHDVSHSFTDHTDWFQGDHDIATHFSSITTHKSFDLTVQYCQDVHKMIVASEAMKFVKG